MNKEFRNLIKTTIRTRLNKQCLHDARNPKFAIMAEGFDPEYAKYKMMAKKILDGYHDKETKLFYFDDEDIREVEIKVLNGNDRFGQAYKYTLLDNEAHYTYWHSNIDNKYVQLTLIASGNNPYYNSLNEVAHALSVASDEIRMNSRLLGDHGYEKVDNDFIRVLFNSYRLLEAPYKMNKQEAEKIRSRMYESFNKGTFSRNFFDEVHNVVLKMDVGLNRGPRYNADNVNPEFFTENLTECHHFNKFIDYICDYFDYCIYKDDFAASDVSSIRAQIKEVLYNLEINLPDIIFTTCEYVIEADIKYVHDKLYCGKTNLYLE